MSTGRQGVQGIQGIQGAEGEIGAGTQGEKGERGPRGRAGSSATKAFVLVVIVATLVTSAIAYKATRDLNHANRDSCMNFLTLRDAVNDFHSTIRTFLVTAQRRSQAAAESKAATPKERAISREAAKIYGTLVANTHTVTATCAQKK